jgi:hypothetical protein
MKQIYVDHQTLTRLAGTTPGNNEESEDYLDFLSRVRKEVESLDHNHRRVITMYYFECLDIKQIALSMKLPPDDIRSLLRESLLMLKSNLADIVAKRWPKRFSKIKRCKICGHPQRSLIEKIVRERLPSDSWGKTNRLIKKQVGCCFNPPTVIINHMKYHTK